MILNWEILNFFLDEIDPLNRFIHSKMQNYVSFCLKIAPEGEKNFEKRLLFMNFQTFYAKI
jgi:predicted HicB family RNase H-like nuclease